MPKISYAGCLSISPAICALKPKICQKFTVFTILWVQDRSNSSMLALAESSSRMLVMISSKRLLIWNRFHARRVDSGKIRTY